MGRMEKALHPTDLKICMVFSTVSIYLTLARTMSDIFYFLDASYITSSHDSYYSVFPSTVCV